MKRPKHWLGEIHPSEFNVLRLIFPSAPQGSGLKLAGGGAFLVPGSSIEIPDSVPLFDQHSNRIGTVNKRADGTLVGRIEGLSQAAITADTLVRDGTICKFYWGITRQHNESLQADTVKKLWQSRHYKPRPSETAILETKGFTDVISGKLDFLMLSTDLSGLSDKFEVSFSEMLTDEKAADREAAIIYKDFKARTARQGLASILSQVESTDF